MPRVQDRYQAPINEVVASDQIADPTPGQVACSMPSMVLRHVRAAVGPEAAERVVRDAGVPYTVAHLDDVSNWIWYDEAMALFEAAAALTGDPRVAQRAGEQAVRQHAGTPVATLLRSLGSPQAILEQVALAATKFSTITEMRAVEVGPGHATVESRVRADVRRSRHACDFRVGLLSQPPVLFGLPPALVQETQCELRGDDRCRYEVTWDAERAAAAADPQQLVTALEAQLAAMAERLNNIYAAAKDLISVDDLDGALARITERSATAVRAPRYLLAVETGDGQVRVHHRGFGGEDVDAAAAALLADDGSDRDPSRIVAEVSSMSRRYGRLMAASPAGGFFPHERELLEIYASYAATVLDTATALAESRRAHSRSRALLELSQSVAAASRTDEVAQQLADVVPAVVDCDRVLVYIWSEEESALSCRAITGFEPEPWIREMRIREGDTAILTGMMRNPSPDPLFFDRNTTDPFLGAMMREQGTMAIIVAPIVAHGRFYGALATSARERPERLDPTPDLLDRLAGVVAQSATAFDNARLIESMAHQARTDNLTGLPGHRAFHEALCTSVDAGRPFSLAMIDIDDFKRINDGHGHPVGDEALCRVAEAMRSAVRGEDEVFRVGGEEFAVVVPGLEGVDAVPVCERVRAAVSTTTFALPLRVSIGLASWPADADDRKSLLQRADEALYAAKRAGKDRTAQVPA
jgi:diguanylate cyclase (GGDEF)-like protein